MAKQLKSSTCLGISTDGRRCRKLTLPNSKFCATHNTPVSSTEMALKDEKAAAKANTASRGGLARMRANFDAVAHPIEELSRLAAEIVMFKDVLRENISTLKISSLRYESIVGVEQVRADVELYERALDRSVKTLTDLAKLNLDERLVKIEESKVSIITSALDVTLASLGLSRDQVDQARRMMAAELRKGA